MKLIQNHICQGGTALNRLRSALMSIAMPQLSRTGMDQFRPGGSGRIAIWLHEYFNYIFIMEERHGEIANVVLHYS